MKQKKPKFISGWFIYWFDIHKRLPEDEWARLILIDQNRHPDKPEQIAEFITKYYLSFQYLSDKIKYKSPKSRMGFEYKAKIGKKKDGGYTISCGHNYEIFAEYRKEVEIPDEDYPAYFPVR